METRQSYPFLVWATTVIIAPLITVFLPAIFNGSEVTKADFQYVGTVYMFSFICSLPVLLVYYIVFNILRKEISSTIIFKWILIGTCIIGIIIMFAVVLSIDVLFISESWYIIGCYSLSAIIASFIFKIQRKDTKISN